MNQVSQHPLTSGIADVVRQLPRWSGQLSQRGFRLPALAHDAVEGLRTRGEGELPFVRYLSEVALESMYFDRGAWNVEGRAGLPPMVRSGYLDLLHARSQTGEADYQSEEAVNKICLDPNERFYLDWSGPQRRAHLDEVVLQKRIDADRLDEAIERFSRKGANVTLVCIKAFLKEACAHFGLEMKARKVDDENQLYMYRSLGAGLTCGAIWGDFRNLLKWGRIAMGFRLEFDEGNDGSPAVLYAKRFGQLFPGGDLYLWHNMDWRLVCLGFLAALNYVSIFAAACDGREDTTDAITGAAWGCETPARY